MGGVALVTGNFSEYLKAFLFSLALTAGVTVELLGLSERAGAAALKLAELWGHHLQEPKDGRPGRIVVEAAMEAEENEEENDEVRLP